MRAFVIAAVPAVADNQWSRPAPTNWAAAPVQQWGNYNQWANNQWGNSNQWAGVTGWLADV